MHTRTCFHSQGGSARARGVSETLHRARFSTPREALLGRRGYRNTVHRAHFPASRAALPESPGLPPPCLTPSPPPDSETRPRIFRFASTRLWAFSSQFRVWLVESSHRLSLKAFTLFQQFVRSPSFEPLFCGLRTRINAPAYPAPGHGNVRWPGFGHAVLEHPVPALVRTPAPVQPKTG